MSEDFDYLEYHEQNPYCEWSYWIEGKKRYTSDYIDGYVNDILSNGFAKTEIHHIFGRVSNSVPNLINILQTPLHSRSHSHNTNYDKNLLIDYCLIKVAKGELRIKFLKEHNKLHLFHEIAERYRELKNNRYFQRACSKYAENRIYPDGYDILEMFESFGEPKLELIDCSNGLTEFDSQKSE